MMHISQINKSTDKEGSTEATNNTHIHTGYSIHTTHTHTPINKHRLAHTMYRSQPIKLPFGPHTTAEVNANRHDKHSGVIYYGHYGELLWTHSLCTQHSNTHIHSGSAHLHTHSLSTQHSKLKGDMRRGHMAIRTSVHYTPTHVPWDYYIYSCYRQSN